MAYNGDKEGKEEDGDEEASVGKDVSEFRGVVARMNYLAQDTPDMQFPVLSEPGDVEPIAGELEAGREGGAVPGR